MSSASHSQEAGSNELHHVGSSWSRIAGLSLGAIGVVYGDIGTSPLYAVRECFNHHHHMAVTPESVFGIISLILWALIAIVSVKYLGIVIRADNHGEGGILALMALAIRGRKHSQRTRNLLVLCGLLGAALLYGDGMITPAISVMSAVEGLTLITSRFESSVQLVTICILVGLFAVQFKGTGSMGRYFGPVVCIWFAFMACIGIPSIVASPEILAAFNPLLGLSFISSHGKDAFVALGAVFLAVTGTEALYADMGHFGRTPIRYGWFFLVLPSLTLNYLGQGALLLRQPELVSQPFFHLVPAPLLIPAVVLATMATVIASQALISGCFSLSNQAIQLGYLPRLPISHTSGREQGQIYIPWVNYGMLVGCCLLVGLFSSSSGLAAAYGIAVALTMSLTTILVAVVARRWWRWSLTRISFSLGLYLLIDLVFVFSNSSKLLDGGIVPLFIAGLMMLLMTTWKTGKALLWNHIRERVPPITSLPDEIERIGPAVVEGTAIFLVRDPGLTPASLTYNMRHNRVLHARNLLLTVKPNDVPWWPDETTRVSLEHLQWYHGASFVRCIVNQGFMESVDLSKVLSPYLTPAALGEDPKDVTYFVDRVTPVADSMPGMAIWRERLFSFMNHNAEQPTEFFKLPVSRVMEIGLRIEI
jgi:KUP system potassium uptake protein